MTPSPMPPPLGEPLLTVSPRTVVLPMPERECAWVVRVPSGMSTVVGMPPKSEPKGVTVWAVVRKSVPSL